MRICLLARFFDASKGGGIARYSEEIREALRREGHEVVTVSQGGGIPLGEGRLKYLIYTAMEISFKIPRNCDIYHACSPLEAVYAPRPLSVFFHDLVPLLWLGSIKTHYARGTLSQRLVKRYFEWHARAALEKADVILAQSGQTRREISELFNIKESEIVVIRHGISPELKPEEKRDDIFRIGSLGFDCPRKRFHLLMDAFLEARVDGELHIAGKGTEVYDKFAGNDKIRGFGRIPDKDLPKFFNSLDCFIFPSKVEGYGLPIIEAFACKVPVVTLTDSSIPGDVKDRTIVVEDLTEWLKNPSFEEIDLESNYRFAKLHSWGRCAEKHLEVFEEIT